MFAVNRNTISMKWNGCLFHFQNSTSWGGTILEKVKSKWYLLRRYHFEEGKIKMVIVHWFQYELRSNFIFLPMQNLVKLSSISITEANIPNQLHYIEMTVSSFQGSYHLNQMSLATRLSLCLPGGPCLHSALLRYASDPLANITPALWLVTFAKTITTTKNDWHHYSGLSYMKKIIHTSIFAKSLPWNHFNLLSLS